VSGPDEKNPGREAILEALARHNVEYVVIGGAAAQARGWPRLTNDIDVTPERSKENLSRLAGALEELSAGFRVDERRYPDGYRPPGGLDWRTFRSQVSITFATPHGDVDVVLRPDGTDGYEDIIRTATPERVTGTDITTQVASAETILRSKDAANRPKDRETLPELRKILDPYGLYPSQHDGQRSRSGPEPPERGR
jgi:hypothetical protein